MTPTADPSTTPVDYPDNFSDTFSLAATNGDSEAGYLEDQDMTWDYTSEDTIQYEDDQLGGHHNMGDAWDARSTTHSEDITDSDIWLRDAMSSANHPMDDDLGKFEDPECFDEDEFGISSEELANMPPHEALEIMKRKVREAIMRRDGAYKRMAEVYPKMGFSHTDIDEPMSVPEYMVDSENSSTYLDEGYEDMQDDPAYLDPLHDVDMMQGFHAASSHEDIQTHTPFAINEGQEGEAEGKGKAADKGKGKAADKGKGKAVDQETGKVKGKGKPRPGPYNLSGRLHRPFDLPIEFGDLTNRIQLPTWHQLDKTYGGAAQLEYANLSSEAPYGFAYGGMPIASGSGTRSDD